MNEDRDKLMQWKSAPRIHCDEMILAVGSNVERSEVYGRRCRVMKGDPDRATG